MQGARHSPKHSIYYGPWGHPEQPYGFEPWEPSPVL